MGKQIEDYKVISTTAGTDENGRYLGVEATFNREAKKLIEQGYAPSTELVVSYSPVIYPSSIPTYSTGGYMYISQGFTKYKQ